MVITSSFDPFSQNLSGNHRLRIKKGKFIHEDFSHRKNSHFIYRFITRSQYNQSAILTKMNRLYQKAEKNNSLTKEFLNNYQFVITNADKQNQRHKNTCWLIRLLLAKTFINTAPYHSQLAHLMNEAPSPMKVSLSDPITPQAVPHISTPEPTSTEKDVLWDSDVGLNENIVDSEIIGNLNCFFPADLLTFFPNKLAIKSENDQNIAKNIPLLFDAIGLLTVQDFINANIRTRQNFIAYLNDNKDQVVRNILDKNFEFIELRAN